MVGSCVTWDQRGAEFDARRAACSGPLSLPEWPPSLAPGKGCSPLGILVFFALVLIKGNSFPYISLILTNRSWEIQMT